MNAVLKVSSQVENSALIPNFQDLIKNSNISQILELDKALMNKPLSNSELPLQYAVRLNKPDVVNILLEMGADPELRDFQNLSAIDHAVLIKDESILALLLGNRIGIQLKEVEEQIKCKGSASHVNALKTQVKTIASVNVNCLNSQNKAVYQGDCTAIKEQVTAQNIDQLDVNGLAPIHYAILSGKFETVNQLIELGANTEIVSKDGDSVLHFAAINGSLQIVKLLTHSKDLLNHQNKSGSTALHYATAKENLAVVEMLVRQGANPNLVDNQGMSALSVIGTSAYERDPLSLPKSQIILFMTASLFWLSTLASTSAWVTNNLAKNATFILSIGAAIAASWSEFTILIANLNQSWKQIIAWIGMFGLAAIPPFNVGFQAWSTYYVARSALGGLKNCWKNMGYRNWTVGRNIVVHSVNTAYSTAKLYSTCVITYELGLHAFYLSKMWYASRNNNEDAYFEAWEEYLNFLKDRYNFGKETIDVSQCKNIQPSMLISLSTIERLRNSDLNPKCVEHALMMIDPHFTIEMLRQNSSSFYKKAYRKLMLNEVHPDKIKNSPESKEAAVRLVAAYETLNEWVKKISKLQNCVAKKYIKAPTIAAPGKVNSQATKNIRGTFQLTAL